MHICVRILNLEIMDKTLKNMAESSNDIEKKSKNYEWKVKILTTDFITCLFAFSKREIVTQNWKGTLSITFFQNYSKGILEMYFKLLQCKTQGQFVPPSMLMNILKTFGYALDVDFGMMILAPYLDSLMFDHVLPLLKVDHKDIELWEEMPQQYVYAIGCRFDNHIRLKEISKDLIYKICKLNNPNGNSFLYVFINFTHQCFTKKVNPRNGNPIDEIYKELLLHSFECLADQIFQEDSILNQMESIFQSSILPELKSTEGFLRARACSVFNVYGSNFEFKQQQNVIDLCNGVCQNMQDKD